MACDVLFRPVVAACLQGLAAPAARASHDVGMLARLPATGYRLPATGAAVFAKPSRRLDI